MRIVMSGNWLYDGSVDKQVDIVALDSDFWYEIAKADGMLEEDERPEPLGPTGELYYVRFGSAGIVTEHTWVDSGGYPTADEAKSHAQTRVPSPIRWNE